MRQLVRGLLASAGTMLVLLCVLNVASAQAVTWPQGEQQMANDSVATVRDSYITPPAVGAIWTRANLIASDLPKYKTAGIANVLLWGTETTEGVPSSGSAEYWTGCGSKDTPAKPTTGCPNPSGLHNLGYSLIDSSLPAGSSFHVITENGALIAEVCGNYTYPVPADSSQSAPTISGYKFDDLNGNGQWDTGEPGLPGWTIELIQNNAVIATTVTNSSGYYSFRLDAQTMTITGQQFQLAEVPQNGWQQIVAPGTVTVPWGSGADTFANNDFGNEQKTDIAITKSASSPTTVAGEDVSWTMKVTNDGIFATPNVTVTDPIPAGLEDITALSPGCSLSAGVITCDVGTLGSGATQTLSFSSEVNPDVAKGAVITNTASVTSSYIDTNTSNNVASAKTTVDTSADLSVTKTADATHFLGGDAIDYTLAVTNDGPSYARSVTLNDTVPPQVAVLGTSDDSACSVSGQAVSCDVGDLAPGASASVVIDGSVLGSPPGAANPSHGDHQLLIGKQEVFWNLQAGQHGTIDASCPSGEIATDGSFRVDAVDQGTGTLGSVLLSAEHAISLGTYEFDATNTATGQAQGHATVTCLAPTTVGGDGPALNVGTDPQQSQTDTLAPGLQTVTLEPGLDRHAVAPGYDILSGAAQLVASQPTTDGGWTLTYQVTSAATILSTILPLHDTLDAAADGHTNALVFNDLTQQVTVPPGDSQYGLDCGEYAKGITASFDLPPGVLMTGNEPRPQIRNFWLENTTSQSETVTLDVLCLNVRTHGPIDAIGIITNTATGTSTTSDPNLANNTSTVQVSVETAYGTGVVGSQTPLLLGAQLASRTVSTTVSSPVRSSVRVELRVAGRVVASHTILVRAHQRRTVRFRLSRTLAARLRHQGGSVSIVTAHRFLGNRIIPR